MPDWTKSMEQTFEYYIVDPETWANKSRINNVKSCLISRDLEAETLGSATIDISESIGEEYIREYLVTNQNGIIEKFPLGTHLVQTPSSRCDGKSTEVSIDAYTPLMELKENPPLLGYALLKGENIMDRAYMLTREHARAPVIQTKDDKILFDHFVSNTDDTWLSFISDLLRNAKYQFDLDEMGRILFAPKQNTAALQHVWTYDDNNSSILFPEVTVNHDLYGIPNVVEIIHSTDAGSFSVRAVNNDSSSPTSTVARGREITYRETNPSFAGNPTKEQVQDYAEQLLRDMSSIEYTLSYTHAYCPVRVGDCVRLNHSQAGLNNVKAKVISQTIKCEPGCPVTETATYTSKLWR